jgi:hypothetical protein
LAQYQLQARVLEIPEPEVGDLDARALVGCDRQAHALEHLARTTPGSFDFGSPEHRDAPQ